MPIDYFWQNLRTAASEFGPPAMSADAAERDTDAWERRLQNPDRWLTPRSVDGFDPTDFDFLESEQREALRRSVEAFLAVAAAVPRKKAASPRQVREGGTAFSEILRILQPHRFWDADSFRIQTVLDRDLRGKLPSWVTGICCETGTDVGDDPAVWIYVRVTDAATEKGLIAKHWQEIDDQIKTALRKVERSRWPYIRYQNPSDLVDSEGRQE
jgi:hypothetical protein